MSGQGESEAATRKIVATTMPIHINRAELYGVLFYPIGSICECTFTNNIEITRSVH